MRMAVRSLGVVIVTRRWLLVRAWLTDDESATEDDPVKKRVNESRILNKFPLYEDLQR
jgi:hypothetical protein